ncbi:hypothetical protein REPUB_Repub18cG0170500 [Reevesia pubescens]
MRSSNKPNPFHLLINYIFINILLLDGVVTQTTQNTSTSTTPVNIGVVLDMDSLVGQIGLSCINMALADFYASHPYYKTRLVFHTKDSKEDLVTAAAAALDLIRNVEVQAIIGPRSSMQANFVISLGNKSQVPIISFSATSPSLASLQTSYFFRAAQNGSFQVKAISAIVQAFGWREVVPIYVDNQFGESLIPYLTDALQEINTRVPYLSVIPASATDDQIDEELYKLMTMQTRVFIVHMTMSPGSRILARAKEIGMMNEGYVWIMTDSMTTLWRSIDASAIDSLQGILGVRSYVPKSEKLENFKVRWKRQFQQDNPNTTNVEMNIFGLWAYDATFALAMAIEKAGTANLRFTKTNISSGTGATDLETLGVSQNGPRLIQELSDTKFRGLSGDFHFVNGQLQSSVFQIVNVLGNGERRVGFWTPKDGLVRKLDSRNTSTNSANSKPKLGPIIWPGDTNLVPKGWELPTNGKKLRIGVPVKENGFKEFVDLDWDPVSQKAKSIKGYCIDIFDAVMAKMPYGVPYEYIPFATPDGKFAGSYDDLTNQVVYGIYDAVVGDTTIVANRSLLVDFTLPYTESGVSMIVPIRDNKKKNAWAFLKPLTWDLWVTSGSFFVFIGFVVWILEHRINEDFRGPPLHQVGTSFWFSFSTMVFAHRETVASNLARFVVIIWCFVVLILTQSYTASLTSLLTVEQLQPTVTDINELLKRRENVGFLAGSFVEGILLGLKFDKGQLKKYESLEELHDLFAIGSANGGISAALDEIPYIKLFLAKYCGKYTTVEPTYKTDGFGFIFPKGSPIVGDVSRAILNVTQGDQMEQIQNKWFKNEAVCPNFDPSVSSHSLGLESFWGLFLIVGVASISALVIFAAMFLTRLLLIHVVVAQNTTNIPVNVGVVLDFDKQLGKVGLSCINMALSDFYATHASYRTRLVLHSRDSNTDIVAAAAAALDLIKNVEVQAIIGPQTSMEANFVINLGNKSRVPIISYSATSPSLTFLRSPYFFRATQNDSSQVNAISAIVQAFGWREAVPIYVDDEFGEGIMPYLTDALQEINARLPYRSVIPSSASGIQIREELYKLMTLPTRVFIVHMPPSLGTRLFSIAKQIGMMIEGFAWVVTDGMANLWTLTDPSAIDSMQGVLGVRTYIPRTNELENFRVRWKRKFQQDNPSIINAELNFFGLRAYDASFALAMAIENVSMAANFSFNKTTVSSNVTDLETFGVSKIGPQLIQALSSTKFRGLTGDIHFVNGQLQSSAFQIVNVNGNGERRVGFWTPKLGLVRELNLRNRSTSSNYKPNLGPIIWPGDTTSPPKGWEIPPNGKKLRIGVPVKDGFSEFVKVTWDPTIQTATSVTGYCIDVFDAVMAAMPYAVTYEFIPFATPDGKSAGTYNDLIFQVYNGTYDAAVGDITIVANRSRFVDFTLPYTESGVSMIVPIKDKKTKNAWIFLKPLTWDLWVTSACFFVFIGFVVWVLEHRINEDFRGPPWHQAGTSFWFSFSTMVFAHRERVVSNLARFVVIIWCFVVLILTQSYTASLTSLLTVQQLQPAVTDIHELVKKGEKAGFQQGSFAEGILKGLDFAESQLIEYQSPEELHQLFENGRANGGIAAALDEIPYMKLFLAKYCSKYTTVEPTFKTDGFGFVFPRGSPLVADVSRAILNVTQGEKMKQIENAWFQKESTCPDPNSLVSSNSLGVESFWGLFLITGVASILALIIFAVMFLYEQRHVLLRFDSETPIWRRIRIMSRIFDQRDLSSHTFRKSELGDKSGNDSTVHRIGVAGDSPNTNCPPSPSSYSNQTEPDFAFLVDQGRGGENGDLSPSEIASPEIIPSPRRHSIELTNRNEPREPTGVDIQISLH